MVQKLHAKVTPFNNDPKNALKNVDSDDVPKELTKTSKSLHSWICGDYVYFVFPKKLQRYHLENGTVESVKISGSINKMMSFDNQYFYWRQEDTDAKRRFISKIHFDRCDNFKCFGQKTTSLDNMVFMGIFPHNDKLQYDSMGESVAAFTSVYNLTIFPLLHTSRIKIKVEGKRPQSNTILAVQEKGNYFFTLQNDDFIRMWNIQTGKVIRSIKVEEKFDKVRLPNYDPDNFKDYIFEQRID